jgi:hypothetical protein
MDAILAYEMLARSVAATGTGPPIFTTKTSGPSSSPPAAEQQGSVVTDFLWGTKRRQGMVETMAKQAARTVGSQLGRQILRGVLGGILGGRRRS